MLMVHSLLNHHQDPLGVYREVFTRHGMGKYVLLDIILCLPDCCTTRVSSCTTKNDCLVWIIGSVASNGKLKKPAITRMSTMAMCWRLRHVNICTCITNGKPPHSTIVYFKYILGWTGTASSSAGLFAISMSSIFSITSEFLPLVGSKISLYDMIGKQLKHFQQDQLTGKFTEL